MSTKRSKLFAASPSLYGPGKSGKEYVWSGGLPKLGTKSGKKLQTPGSTERKLEAPNAKLHPPSSTAFVKSTMAVTGGSPKLRAPNPQVTPHLKASGSGLVAKSFAKLKGLIGGRKASTKPAIPRFAPGPIQCELSLDNVKVLRNDLSDTDFELVAKPAAPKKAVPAEPMPPAVLAAPESRAKIWNRVTALLGAGQS